MEFIDSKSYKNLEKAFQDEAVTVLKYTFFAAKARKEGREDIAKLFEKIRTNEYEHAKMIFSNLYDDNQTLEQVLKSVTEEENFDWKYNYPELANIAKAENYPNIMIKFCTFKMLSKKILQKQNLHAFYVAIPQKKCLVYAQFVILMGHL